MPASCAVEFLFQCQHWLPMRSQLLLSHCSQLQFCPKKHHHQSLDLLKGHGQSKTPFPKMESPKGKAPKHTGQAKPGISVGWLDSDSGEHVRSAGDVGEGVAGTVGSASSVGECVGKAGNVSCCKAGSDDGDLGSSALSPIVGSSTGSAKASKPSARFLCRRHHGAESM